MKRILGLDLGSASAGWSALLIDEKNLENSDILGLGVRLIPMSPEENEKFNKNKGLTSNQQRTSKRGLRRNIDRTRRRKAVLRSELVKIGLGFDDDLLKLPPLQLWQLRADAASETKLSPAKIGRVIYHLNMRRGYRPSKTDTGSDLSQHLTAIRSRADEAASAHQTPGQYFARKLHESVTVTLGGKVCNYRVKEQIFPREDYENELRLILNSQSVFYPEILTPEVQNRLFQIVFYQRPLKSCKHLVSVDPLLAREYLDKNGNKVIAGPKVAPVSSPLAQVCHLWETVNNICLKNSRNRRNKDAHSGERSLKSYEYPLTDDERQAVFNYLNTHRELSIDELLNIVGLKTGDGFSLGSGMKRYFTGNKTRADLAEALGDMDGASELLRFNLSTAEYIDEKTGEICRKISSDYLREPLYILWHTVYSISDRENLRSTLERKFAITDPDVVDRLYRLNFKADGYASKSSRLMCAILPGLMDGLQYSEACEKIGLNHSGSLTSQENADRPLSSSLTHIPKGELRQPIVERVLNQMVTLVNAAIVQYGPFDEIRVELARDLRQDKKTRQNVFERMDKQKRENDNIAKEIEKLGLRPSANKILKYRLWLKNNRKCMYCDDEVDIKKFLIGYGVEKEHVIPRSRFFDNSFSNRVCACSKCNHEKGDSTAFDFMAARGEEDFNKYKSRVEDLYKKGTISKTKRDLLMTSGADIPDDFLNRDLSLTQFINRKAVEMLKSVCRNVTVTSGSVTDFFRHAWGYDHILHDINLPLYSAHGKTEIVDTEINGIKVSQEVITGWSKRSDHRHHAIDALVVALTRAGYIQRLNNLNQLHNSDFQPDSEYAEARVNLDKWAAKAFHFPVSTVTHLIENTVVSTHTRQRVTVPGKRKYGRGKNRTVVQTLLVPRGPLTDDSVFGKRIIREYVDSVDVLFDRIDTICNRKIRKAIADRLAEFHGKLSPAKQSCKSEPIIVPSVSHEPIKGAYCYSEKFVLRRPVGKLTDSQIKGIVDPAIRNLIENRRKEFGNIENFKKSVKEAPIFTGALGSAPIRHVRTIVPKVSEISSSVVRRDPSGNPIGYSKTNNNHHVAFYINPHYVKPKDEIEELIVSFNSAVALRNHNLPVIIDNPEEVWDTIENSGAPLSPDLLKAIPNRGRSLTFSMVLGDTFILGIDHDKVTIAIESHDYSDIIPHLYELTALTQKDCYFRKVAISVNKKSEIFLPHIDIIRTTYNPLLEANPIKVAIDPLGNFTIIGSPSIKK